MSRSSKEVEINCTIIGETVSGLRIDDGKQKVCIPKSQITDECEDKGRIISIFIPEWLAYEKGLI